MCSCSLESTGDPGGYIALNTRRARGREGPHLRLAWNRPPRYSAAERLLPVYRQRLRPRSGRLAAIHPLKWWCLYVCSMNSCFRYSLPFTGGLRYPISGVCRAGQNGQSAESTSFAFSRTGQ